MAPIPNQSTRACLVTKTEGSYYDGTYRSWQEPATFHAWTKSPRCAIGDGSAVDWETLAIVEWPDGTVDTREPRSIKFLLA